MKRRSRKNQGQVVVLVALMITILLLFTALVVDGSNAHQQRRRCQNAADSAALAALVEATTRITVNGVTTESTNQTVQNTAVEYVRQHIGPPSAFEAQYIDNQNRKIGTVLSFGAGSAPPSDAAGIWVYAQIRYNLFLGRIVGVNAKVSDAQATARVRGNLGALNRGAFPVAVNDDLLRNVTAGQEIRIFDENRISDTAGNVIVGGQRGWLNFNFIYNGTDTSRVESTSQSNDDLRAWVRQGYDAAQFAGGLGGVDGDFIDGDPGTRSSTIQEAGNRVGDIVFLPVFDTIYGGSALDNTSLFPNQPTPDFMSTGTYYHIIGFAAFRISDVDRSGSDKFIQGSFQYFVRDGQVGGSGIPGIGGTIGGVGGIPGTIQSIGLAPNPTGTTVHQAGTSTELPNRDDD